MIDRLKQITLLPGISGFEEKVSSYIKKEVTPLVDDLLFDNIGSLIAHKKAIGPKVMLAAHMDEIGLLVTEITSDGYLKFNPIGGWFQQVMLAQRWQIVTKKGILVGVTGVKPPHLIPLEKRKEVIQVTDMYIDIGAKSKEEAIELGVELGNMIAPKVEFEVLGNGDLLLSKAWDDRIGCAVLIAILKELKAISCDLYCTFTVQEEVGCRGAKTTANIVLPEIAFAIDVSIANDVPGGFKEEVSLGKGPQIHLMDSGLIAHQGLREFVIAVAKEENIPFQEPYLAQGRTDAAFMHLAGAGAAALSIGIPNRYMHSHSSIIHKADFLNTVKLMVAVIQKLNKETVNTIVRK